MFYSGRPQGVNAIGHVKSRPAGDPSVYPPGDGAQTLVSRVVPVRAETDLDVEWHAKICRMGHLVDDQGL